MVSIQQKTNLVTENYCPDEILFLSNSLLIAVIFTLNTNEVRTM